MAKRLFFVLIAAIASYASFSQTSKPKLDEVKVNPATTTNAAKADAQLINKKAVTDSEALKTALVKQRDKHKLKRKRKSTRTSR